MNNGAIRTLLGCAGLAGALLAQTPDPLWQQSQLQVALLEARVAKQMKIHMEFMDGNEKSSNSFDDVYQLQGWKDGKPVQALQSHQGQGEFVKAGLAPDNLDLTKSADHPETLLRFGPQDQLQRLADATLGGRDCAVFLVETTKGKAKKTRRIWVEKATALPLRVEVALAGAPMVKAFTALVDFQRSPDGVWGPGRSSIALTMSILFKTIQMKTSVEFTEWSKRP